MTTRHGPKLTPLVTLARECRYVNIVWPKIVTARDDGESIMTLLVEFAKAYSDRKLDVMQKMRVFLEELAGRAAQLDGMDLIENMEAASHTGLYKTMVNNHTEPDVDLFAVDWETLVRCYNENYARGVRSFLQALPLKGQRLKGLECIKNNVEEALMGVNVWMEIANKMEDKFKEEASTEEDEKADPALRSVRVAKVGLSKARVSLERCSQVLTAMPYERH